ncbi:hypothetical protein KBK19_11015 [Microvirga sp. STR05]|uniref:YcxB family protein n=1 Tax=Hymenobacter duratus TaxID=2771356 RepID=A0ABR8JFB3_9BACT|nr:hypothetical protein [Hymenobacter duratus]MBD2715567.1 hypothetical protein [Hymenobacter duratus]MBR7950475.1 hypothetical protein [Microvirga sp. STR05]
MPASITVSETQLSALEFTRIHQIQEQRRYPDAVRQRQIAPLPSPAGWNYWWVAGWILLLLAGIWLAPELWQRYLRLALFASLITVIGLLYQRYEYRKAFRQSPTAGLNTRFEVLETGIIVEHEGRFTTFLWREFYRIRHIESWVLLYPNQEFCYYLDLRNVQPPATASQVLNLLTKHKLLTH